MLHVLIGGEASNNVKVVDFWKTLCLSNMPVSSLHFLLV